MSTFTLAISCLTTSNLPWFTDLLPGSCAILLFTASDLASITSHIHSWVLFLLWLHPLILSGVLSPLISSSILSTYWPGGSDGKASVYNEGDLASIPGLGRSPGEGNGNPLHYSCLENPRDGGAWCAAVYGVTQSRTRLKWFSSSSSNYLPKAHL